MKNRWLQNAKTTLMFCQFDPKKEKKKKVHNTCIFIIFKAMSPVLSTGH
jgi:hypothetical protein